VAQIVLNLLLNAADALRGGALPPRITVSVGRAAARWRVGEGPEAASGRRQADAVECRVTDNGPGIAEEDRERIFDPFFTTKPPGEGTGLGLSNAARFAEELGGSLTLAAHEGTGAVFVLRLPAAGGDPGGAARGGATAQSAA
jgi:signal transduction histidine kinase